MPYQRIFRSLPCAVAIVDSDLVVRDATDAFASATGVPLDRQLGASLALGLEPPEEWATLARAALAVATPFEGPVTLAGGQPARLAVRPVERDADGTAGLAVLLETSGPEARLAELFEALRGLKHEMNNPLTGALGNINLLLRRSDLDERARRRLVTAEQEIKKVSALVMRLSELAPISETN